MLSLSPGNLAPAVALARTLPTLRSHSWFNQLIFNLQDISSLRFPQCWFANSGAFCVKPEIGPHTEEEGETKERGRPFQICRQQFS